MPSPSRSSRTCSSPPRCSSTSSRAAGTCSRTCGRSCSTTTSRGRGSTSSRGARSGSSGRCAARASSSVLRDPAARAAVIRLTVDLQPNFALNQPLSPFALAAIGLLDPDEAPGRPARHRALRPRRRERHRVDARRPAAGAVPAAVPRPRRGGRRDEARGPRLRRAHGGARGGDLSEAARGAARAVVRGLRVEPAVGARLRAVAEVGRARHVRARTVVRRATSPSTSSPAARGSCCAT